MKEKITISIDENILSRIDLSVKNGDGKNRSSVIENILKQRFGDFMDVSVIIFAHDYKWDNREYPFDIPKALLEVRKKTIATRQSEIFVKTGVKNIIFCIPDGATSLFEDELLLKFPNTNFIFLEMDSELKTGEALKEVFKRSELTENLVISNGDIFYGNLNLEEYYNYHRDQKSDFSLALKFVLNPEQLGNVKINGNKIIEFVERPKASQMNLTNSGLYITRKDFLEKNDFGDYLEKDFFPRLPEISNNVRYIYSGEWGHIQNDSAYERINGWLI